MDKLEVQIVTPERRVFAEEIDEIILPSIEGYFGVRPGHAPLLAQLGVGQVSCFAGGKPTLMAISGGFAEVLRGGVTVLATNCEPADEIDADRAAAARTRAEERLQSKRADVDTRRAELALARAMNRLATVDRVRGMM